MDNSRLSHGRALTSIGDPIHKYIQFTIFEREVIDSSYYQRLHFVLQNPMTYAAYPANKNSRFAHSLGVAFIAGQIFTQAVNNSSSDDLKDFLAEFAGMIESNKTIKNTNANELIAGWEKSIKGRSHFVHNPFFHSERELLQDSRKINDKYPALFLVDTLWEAVRICGLVHDIGHLPMSHSFEHAIEKISPLFQSYNACFKSDTSSKSRDSFIEHFKIKQNQFIGNSDSKVNDYYYEWYANLFNVEISTIKNFIPQIAFHERRSLSIMLRLSSINAFALEGDLKKYRSFVWLLASSLLFSQALDSIDQNTISTTKSELKPPRFLYAVKKIVASELDADRLDYTIRDGHACGTHIGRFDLERITNNAILVKQNGSDNYHIAYHKDAVSGIEQFFSQRYDSYKYLINQRTSSRSEACLQELICRVLHIAYMCPNSIFASLLESYGYINFVKPKDVRDIVEWVEEGINEKRSNEIYEFLPNDELSLLRTDDANLRTLLFRILDALSDDAHIKDSLAKQSADDLYGKLVWPIKCLCEVVLLRNFDHVYSPFKNNTSSQMIEAAVGCFTNKDEKQRAFSDLTKYLLESTIVSEFAIKLNKDIQSISGGKVIALTGIIKPKIFDSRKENDRSSVKIVTEYKQIVNLSESSEMLNQMYHRERQEVQLIVYFVGEKIKRNSSMVSSINTVLSRNLGELMLSSIDNQVVQGGQ